MLLVNIGRRKPTLSLKCLTSKSVSSVKIKKKKCSNYLKVLNGWGVENTYDLCHCAEEHVSLITNDIAVLALLMLITRDDSQLEIF